MAPAIHSYRVLVYGPDGRTGWTLCERTADLDTALVVALEYRRVRLIAAVVSVTAGGVPKIKVVEANVPRPKNLVLSASFRTVATAL